MTYENKQHELIADVRKDVGNEDLPFIVGNLAAFFGTGKDHSQSGRHRVQCDRKSYIILGERYAKVYADMNRAANPPDAGNGQ